MSFAARNKRCLICKLKSISYFGNCLRSIEHFHRTVKVDISHKQNQPAAIKPLKIITKQQNTLFASLYKTRPMFPYVFITA